jgi:hypothetical protein
MHVFPAGLEPIGEFLPALIGLVQELPHPIEIRFPAIAFDFQVFLTHFQGDVAALFDAQRHAGAKAYSY